MRGGELTLFASANDKLVQWATARSGWTSWKVRRWIRLKSYLEGLRTNAMDLLSKSGCPCSHGKSFETATNLPGVQ